MCEMLSINGLVPGVVMKGRDVHFRETLKSLCMLVTVPGPNSRGSPEVSLHTLVLDTLTCCLHMEDPHLRSRGAEALDDSWERFLGYEDPVKTEPADDVLAYVQVRQSNFIPPQLRLTLVPHCHLYAGQVQ
jgi:hypothetical protein